MRRAWLLAALLMLAGLPVQAQTPAGPTAALVISELLPDPAGGREFIELHNPGDDPIDLEGWTVQDAVGTTFTFPAWGLDAGARVVVWGGGATDATGPAWAKATVWNNGGDEATLRDPSGIVIDAFSYGSHPDATLPAPAPGRSLQWDGAWVEGDPTPGDPPGQDPAVTATVQNVPPRVTMGAPRTAFLREGATVSFTVHDDNGDLAGWVLRDEAGPLQNGTLPGSHERAVDPQAPGPWNLSLEATDAAGQTAVVQVTITVHASPIQVTVPEGSIRFPTLRPGDSNITALQDLRIENLDDAPRTPHLDISDFTGPTGAHITVADNLRIGLTDPSTNATTWIDYTGPLTPLPALGPGMVRDVWLQIVQVPIPLAAGDYGTSFTVTP